MQSLNRKPITLKDCGILTTIAQTLPFNTQQDFATVDKQLLRCSNNGCNCNANYKDRSSPSIKIQATYEETHAMCKIHDIIDYKLLKEMEDGDGNNNGDVIIRRRNLHKTMAMFIDDNATIQKNILHIANGIHILRLIFSPAKYYLAIVRYYHKRDGAWYWKIANKIDLMDRGFGAMIGKTNETNQDISYVICGDEEVKLWLECGFQITREIRNSRLCEQWKGVLEWLNQPVQRFPNDPFLYNEDSVPELIMNIETIIESLSRPTVKDIVEAVTMYSPKAKKRKRWLVNEIIQAVRYKLNILQKRGNQIRFRKEGVGFIKTRIIQSLIYSFTIHLPQYDNFKAVLYLIGEQDKKLFKRGQNVIIAKTVKFFDGPHRMYWLKHYNNLSKNGFSKYDPTVYDGSDISTEYTHSTFNKSWTSSVSVLSNSSTGSRRRNTSFPQEHVQLNANSVAATLPTYSSIVSPTSNYTTHPMNSPTIFSGYSGFSDVSLISSLSSSTNSYVRSQSNQQMSLGSPNIMNPLLRKSASANLDNCVSFGHCISDSGGFGCNKNNGNNGMLMESVVMSNKAPQVLEKSSHLSFVLTLQPQQPSPPHLTQYVSNGNDFDSSTPISKCQNLDQAIQYCREKGMTSLFLESPSRCT